MQQSENLFQTMARLIEEGVDPVSNEAEIWDRYGETVAVLILDSSGFSRVSQSHGIVYYLSLLMRLRQLVQKVCDSNQSRRLKFEADNAFATFEHVDDAIASALAIHKAVEDIGLMLTEDEPFTVGIGVGFDRMLYSETLEGYFSEEMNFTSKLGEDVAKPGETLITQRAHAAASPGLLRGFTPRVVHISGVDLDYWRHATCR